MNLSDVIDLIRGPQIKPVHAIPATSFCKVVVDLGWNSLSMLVGSDCDFDTLAVKDSHCSLVCDISNRDNSLARFRVHVRPNPKLTYSNPTQRAFNPHSLWWGIFDQQGQVQFDSNFQNRIDSDPFFQFGDSYLYVRTPCDPLATYIGPWGFVTSELGQFILLDAAKK